MIILKTHDDLQQYLNPTQRHGRLGLVTTMGNLHAGHLSLVEIAQAQCTQTIASIFVNPMQFGPNEDFANYPRTLDHDLALLETQGIDYVFLPTTELLYPTNAQHTMTEVSVPSLANKLCGVFRPGFFTGVATVLAKLFNLIRPDLVVFGEKDFQQLAIVKQMVNDLNMPITVLNGPTKREANGLAMSSRNNYLSAAEREQASCLYRVLQDTAAAVRVNRQIDYRQLETAAHKQLETAGFKPQYFSICRSHDLELATADDPQAISRVILVAAWLGKTRLIDNIII